MAAPNNDTLTAVIASLAQLNIALQAHLEASQVSASNTTTPDLSVGVSARGAQAPNDIAPAVPVSPPPPLGHSLTPPPIYISDDEDEVAVVLDPLSPIMVTAPLDGIESDDWYVVTVGKTPGIYTTWLATAPEVLGVSGKCFKKFRTKADAILAYTIAWNTGKVRRVL